MTQSRKTIIEVTSTDKKSEEKFNSNLQIPGKSCSQIEGGSPLPQPHRYSDLGFIARSIPGMDQVVATVSGYHGTERFNLIKLISLTGASYVGAMTKSTTHLVCWKFEGRKHSLAKQLNTLVVNHRWIEDCIKAGKRVPEEPYSFLSGEEVGPLVLEAPIVADKDTVSSKRKKVPSCQSNACNKSEISVIDLDCEAADQTTWINSCLLTENLLPELGARSNDLSYGKRKSLRKTPKDGLSTNNYSFQKLPLSELDRAEKCRESTFHLSAHSTRKRGIIREDIRKILHVSPHKARRLVRQKPSKGILNSVLPDPEQDCIVKGDSESHDNVMDLDSARNENLSGNQGTTSNSGFHECSRSENEGLETENLNEEKEDRSQTEDIVRLPTSSELSCVICWTEFSAVRGILPCGHRFCYSCIESWADHMASRRKVSACPLCKAVFVTITKVDDASPLDQKIYSQTIPNPQLGKDVFVLPDAEIPIYRPQSSLAPVCCECHSQEPVELLIGCHLCQSQSIHSYCLDPPLLPWTCFHCKDLRMIYQHLH